MGNRFGIAKGVNLVPFDQTPGYVIKNLIEKEYLSTDDRHLMRNLEANAPGLYNQLRAGRRRLWKNKFL